MSFLKDLLTRQGFHVLLLVVGVLLIMVGYHSVSGELSKPQLTPVEPRYVLIILGLVLFVGAIFLFLVDRDLIFFHRRSRIRDSVTGFVVTFRDLELRIDFGALQDLYQPSDRNGVAVLPANEFFDDRCFNDERTAAGAFVRKHFSGLDVSRLHGYVHGELKNRKSSHVEGKLSYGVGTCVYVGETSGWLARAIFAAIATDRQPHGLRAELGTIFKAVEEIKCILAQQRLTEVFLPLLGAGKGGVPPAIALMSLVTALVDARCREGGHHLRTVHVVIYQAPGGSPQVPHRIAKAVLQQVVTLFGEAK
jgi:hypothetical protein